MTSDQMGKHENGYARVERDGYPTPSWCARALAEHVRLEGLRIWEPAAGSGHLARGLESAGARVFASDVDAHPGLDAQFDFLMAGLPAGLRQYDGCVTNPPWGQGNRLAVAFIESGLHRIASNGGFLALLLPTDFDSARTRLHLFHDARFVARISLTSRPVWFERTDGMKAAPKENCAWFVWQRQVLRSPPPPIARHAIAHPKDVTP
jgi:predicted RNA methylase